jgi:hypothetical protein
MTEWITIQESSKLVNKDISVIRKARKKYGFKSKLTETGSWLVDKDDVLKHYEKNKYFFDKEEVEEFFYKDHEINKEDEDFLGDIHSRKAIKRPLPPKGESKYYLITAAQNNTKINLDFWKNLLAVKEHFNAELLVSRLVYNKNNLNTAREKDSVVDENNNQPRYASCLNAYLNDDYLELSNDLCWLGYTNRQITASSPLASAHHRGWDKSFIIPHAKRAMESFPLSYQGSLNNNKKIGYTTGVITTINYIEGEAGHKAELYHTYGACLVKVNDDGSSFVYQLTASKDGNFSICIFDLLFIGGKVLANQSIEAVIFGDTHHGKLYSTKVFEDFFGKNNMFKNIHFKKIILHDTLDFESKSYHIEKDYLKRFVQHHKKQDNVFDELKITVDILNDIKELGDEVIVVESNHDQHLNKFLNGGWRIDDHTNKLLCLYLNYIQYAKAIVDNDIRDSFVDSCIYKPFIDIINDLKTFDGDIYEFACRKIIGLKDNIKFNNSTSDLFIKNILCSLHGDKGCNGAKGGASLKRLSIETIIGHGHGAFTRDFLHAVGFTGVKEAFGYASTANTWTVSFVFINCNGTISHYFYNNGNFR